MGSKFTVTTERRGVIAFRVIACVLLAALVVIGLLSLRAERAEYTATSAAIERMDLIREVVVVSGRMATNRLEAILAELHAAPAVPQPKPKPKPASPVKAPCKCCCGATP